MPAEGPFNSARYTRRVRPHASRPTPAAPRGSYGASPFSSSSQPYTTPLRDPSDPRGTVPPPERRPGGVYTNGDVTPSMPLDTDELLFLNGQPNVRARMFPGGSGEIPGPELIAGLGEFDGGVGGSEGDENGWLTLARKTGSLETTAVPAPALSAGMPRGLLPVPGAGVFFEIGSSEEGPDRKPYPGMPGGDEVPPKGQRGHTQPDPGDKRAIEEADKTGTDAGTVRVPDPSGVVRYWHFKRPARNLTVAVRRAQHSFPKETWVRDVLGNLCLLYRAYAPWCQDLVWTNYVRTQYRYIGTRSMLGATVLASQDSRWVKDQGRSTYGIQWTDSSGGQVMLDCPGLSMDLRGDYQTAMLSVKIAQAIKGFFPGPYNVRQGDELEIETELQSTLLCLAPPIPLGCFYVKFTVVLSTWPTTLDQMMRLVPKWPEPVWIPFAPLVK
ncbi:MAG: hypothetical protein HYZ53_25010 [Planctomycetes bacterium]|nr:hypothetical protein [Planctomycetota bacterium]